MAALRLVCIVALCVAASAIRTDNRNNAMESVEIGARAELMTAADELWCGANPVAPACAALGFTAAFEAGAGGDVGSPDRLKAVADTTPRLINPVLESRKQKDMEMAKNLVVPKLAGTKPLGLEAVMGATSEEPALILGSNQCCNKPPLCPQPCPGQADDFSASAYLPAPVAVPKGCCGQPGCPGPEPCPIMGAALCCEQGCPTPLPAACSKVKYGRDSIPLAYLTPAVGAVPAEEPFKARGQVDQTSIVFDSKANATVHKSFQSSARAQAKQGRVVVHAHDLGSIKDRPSANLSPRFVSRRSDSMLNSAPAEPKITKLPHEPVKDPFSPDLAVQRELQRMEADRDKLMKQLQATQAALSKLSPESRRVEKKFQKELCCNSQLRKLKAHFDKYGLMGDVGFNATNRTSGSANRTRAGPARPLSAEAIQYNATEQRLLTKMMGLEKKSESMKGVGDARSAVLLEMQLLLARILKVARSKAKAFAAAGRKGGRVQLQVNTLKKIKQKLAQLRQLVGKPGVDAVQIGRVEGQLHALIKHALSLQ